jgi:hypothetical protein
MLAAEMSPRMAAILVNFPILCAEGWMIHARDIYLEPSLVTGGSGSYSARLFRDEHGHMFCGTWHTVSEERGGHHLQVALINLLVRTIKRYLFEYLLKGSIFYPFDHSACSGSSALAWFLPLKNLV